MSKKSSSFPILLLLLVFFFPILSTSAQDEIEANPVKIFFPLVNMAEELKSLGPYGGSVTALAISPSQPDIVYAGAYGGGVFISRDRGRTWINSSRGLTNPYVLSMVVDPINKSNVYAGTYGDGVFKSTDGGASWQLTGSGLNEKPIVYTLVINPKSPNILFAGTRQSGELGGGGVFISTNAGLSWEARNYGLGELYIYDLAIDPNSPGTLYAATHERGVFKTFDAGFDWFNYNIGLPEDKSARTLVIDPLNTSNVFLGTWHGDSIYKSINAGGLWVLSNDGIAPAKVYSLAIDPLDPQVLYAATYDRGVYKSDNAGEKWYLSGLYDNFVYSLAVDPSNPSTVLLGMMNNGIYRSENQGGNWGKSMSGLSATSITSLAMASASSPILYAGTNGSGLHATSDNGASWSALTNGLDDSYIFSLLQIPSSPNVLYAGTKIGGVYKSEDWGATWRTVNAGLPTVESEDSMSVAQTTHPFDLDSPEQDLWDEFEDSGGEARVAILEEISVSILSVATDPNNAANLFLGTSGGVYKSTNSGAYWNGSGLSGRVITSVAVDPFQSHIIYAATGASSGSLYKSTDAGKSWVPANVGMVGMDVNALWPDSRRGNVIFAATNNGVYKSVDGAGSWTPSGLAGRYVFSVVGSPTNPAALFAGTAGGVFRSNNYGVDWVSGHPYLASKAIRAVLAHPTTEQTLYAGTNNNGVFLWARFRP